MKGYKRVKLALGRYGLVANFSVISVLFSLLFFLDPEEFLDPDKLVILVL